MTAAAGAEPAGDLPLRLGDLPADMPDDLALLAHRANAYLEQLSWSSWRAGADRQLDYHLADAVAAVYMNDATVYGASPANPARRTKAELARLDAFIVAAVANDHPTTLRSAFYRVMSLGAVPKTETSYAAVGRRLLALRRSGEVPYDWITDGTRYVLHPPSYSSIDDALEATARTYRRALWDRSDAVIQVFSEKDAITGVLAPVCRRWDVALGIARGYSSETFPYVVAETLDPDRLNVLFNFGDHDPSGVNLWENLVAKLRRFAPRKSIVAVRLAVTPEQIDEMRLPLRPTKPTDSRSKTWIYGGSVEVDAIPPAVLRQLLDDAISAYVDERELAILRTVETEERNLIRSMVGRYLAPIADDPEVEP